MLARIQVERAFNPMPKVYGWVLESRNEEDDHGWIQDDRSGQINEKKKEDSLWFKITEIHVSGLKAEPGKTQLWATKTQQQSGTRWLGQWHV